MANRESSFQFTRISGTVYTYANAYIASGGNHDTYARIHFTAGARLNPGAWVWSTGVRADIYINGTKVADKVRIFGDEQDYSGSSSYTEITAELNVNKTHSSQNIVCHVEFYEYQDGVNRGYRQTLTPDAVGISAKTYYTVSYDANGGTDAPPSQTKWYGETLVLQSAKPSRTGYTFKGWATSSGGTVAYAAGGNYTANSSQILYAVWQRITYTVTYMPNGGDGDSFTSTKVYGTALTLASSGFTKQYHTLAGWNTSADGGGTAYALGGSYTANAAVTLYAQWRKNQPSAPDDFYATRRSDTQIVLTWVRPSDADDTWDNVYLERSVNGEVFTPLTDALAGSTTRYVDTTTTANNSYRYRMRAYNRSGLYSSYATSSTIYNTPSAPSEISSYQVSEGSLTVKINLTNTARTAESFSVEYSTDRYVWQTSGMTVDSHVGTPVTEITVTMDSGGRYYYRVRNTGHGLYSGYTESDLTPTIVPPLAPSLNSPATGGYVLYGGSTTSVVFKWTHNPIDNSSQTAAQLRYSINGGAYSTAVQISGSAQQHTLSLSLPLNSQIRWQVRTKGAAADYGEWASPANFSVYKAPTLTITEPSSTITSMPIDYELAYADESGTFDSGRLDVVYNGSTVYTETLASPQSGTIEGAIFAGEFIPDDGETYTFKFTATSSTTVSVTSQVILQVNMTAPQVGKIRITNDPETGYVNIVYGWDENAGGDTAVNATLYRVTDSGRIRLAYTETNDASCLDMYAPLNTEYTYLIITQSSGLAITQIEFSNKLNTGWWFVYYNGKIAKAKWNPNGSRTVKRPERTRVHYIGRKDPVSYDGTAVDDDAQMEWQIIEREYAQQFLLMVREVGRGIYKSGDGEVFHADFDSATIASTFHRNAPYGSLTLPISRIDGEQL